MILNDNLKKWNCIDNEMEQIYNRYLSASGMSVTTMWILYSVYISDGTATQRDICDDWFRAPQTINSAMKALENKGMIELFFAEGNRKSKQVRLTDRGIDLCEKLVKPLIDAENAAFSALSESEQETLVFLLTKYKDALKEII